MLRRAFQATENLGSLTVVLASELQMKDIRMALAQVLWRQVDEQNSALEWCRAGRLTANHILLSLR